MIHKRREKPEEVYNMYLNGERETRAEFKDSTRKGKFKEIREILFLPTNMKFRSFYIFSCQTVEVFAFRVFRRNRRPWSHASAFKAFIHRINFFSLAFHYLDALGPTTFDYISISQKCPGGWGGGGFILFDLRS